MAGIWDDVRATTSSFSNRARCQVAVRKRRAREDGGEEREDKVNMVNWSTSTSRQQPRI